MKNWFFVVGGIIFVGLTLFEPLFLVAVVMACGLAMVVGAMVRLR